MTYSKHTDDANSNSAERFISLLANTTYNSDLQNIYNIYLPRFHLFSKMNKMNYKKMYLFCKV